MSIFSRMVKLGLGIDEDETVAVPDEPMPTLEDDTADASRMEEVD